MRFHLGSGTFNFSAIVNTRAGIIGTAADGDLGASALLENDIATRSDRDGAVESPDLAFVVHESAEQDDIPA